jgi:hypothetical protein
MRIEKKGNKKTPDIANRGFYKLYNIYTLCIIIPCIACLAMVLSLIVMQEMSVHATNIQLILINV